VETQNSFSFSEAVDNNFISKGFYSQWEGPWNVWSLLVSCNWSLSKCRSKYSDKLTSAEWPWLPTHRAESSRVLNFWSRTELFPRCLRSALCAASYQKPRNFPWSCHPRLAAGGAQAKMTSSDPTAAVTQTMEGMAVWRFDREYDNYDMLNIVTLTFIFWNCVTGPLYTSIEVKAPPFIPTFYIC
jgi:hypothetical protein